jgi:hypothetical protein
MQRKGYNAIIRAAGLVPPMPQLDVHVLVERTRKALARTRQNTPPSAGRRLVRDGGVLGRVAEPEERKRLERPIEDDRSRGGSTSCREGHGDKVDCFITEGQERQ